MVATLARWWVLPVLLTTAIGLSGCTTTVVRKNVERKLKGRLAEWIGPAEKYQVKISETRDPELVLGRARRVEITGRKIRANEGFTVEWFHLTLQGLRYDGEAPYFVSVEKSELELELSEADVNQYLATYQSRYSPQITLGPDELQVKMAYPFLGTPTRIEAAGKFVIKNDTQLLFDARTANVSFLNQPGFGERFVEDRVNPLVDLGRVRFPARLESVQILQGRLRAKGTAVLPPQPGRD
jgi:hypothetical protein